ncbi:uncharacterized protein LOC121422499 [Lytechinus variegatus]|uniref:uncharacterized protein LOC121422499 n=1 Tax=Lytechinus variegatus TaxID=7654 RepID=UPI001BB11326|nr:uncharacterized protein LOC121422499 [Lytechinus variegatus]
MAVSLGDIKAKRSQAVAPRSLFGTVIEVTNEDDIQHAKSLPVPQRHVKKDKLTNFMAPEAKGLMKKELAEVERQVHKARFAENDLKEASHLALTFQPNPDTIKTGIPDGALTFQPKNKYAPYKHDIKLHSRDISLTEHFNKPMGLDANPDYNYERYRRPYTNGQFQQAGTILGKGGAFQKRDDESKSMRETFPPTTRRVRKAPSPGIKPGHRAFPNDTIPDNIRFLHGEDLCKEVAKSPEILQKATTPPSKRIPGPLITAKFPPVKTSIPSETDPMYAALGTSLKQDIFNGVPYSHLKSLYKSSYTQNIHDKSDEAFPPKFAIQRNADSKWNEDGVIRMKLYKAWDAMMAERLQAKGGGAS